MKVTHLLLLLVACWLPYATFAQNLQPVTAPLDNMDFFRPTGKANWQIVGDVNADLQKNEAMITTAGKGVLVNLPNPDNRANLISVLEHGDIDIEFDFMMALHSNSGFYLQGRYEIQLYDSWGKATPYSGDCGGIYQRRKLPEGTMYEGHAPRLNACLAPGLWQNMKISFQAPRFDANGQKIANAKVLKIVMNGVTIHQNVELSGPTGGPISETEAPKGPIMIQGDHGAVAFRNIRYRVFEQPAATLSNHQYKVYGGTFEQLAKIPADWKTVKLLKQGTSPQLTWEVSPEANNFAVDFKSTFTAPQAGDYRFVITHGGAGRLRINGQDVVKETWAVPSNRRSGVITLPAGTHTLEVTVSKVDGWLSPALGVSVEGPGFRETDLHAVSSMLGAPPRSPILVNGNENTILRSFMDTPQGRLVHAVNVGTPQKLNFTYDPDRAALAQIWKGEFLDASPMWDDRGDGSSRPRGAVLWLGNQTTVGKLQNGFMLDTLAADAQYRQLGYDLDANGLPIFRYQMYGATLEEGIRPDEGGKMLLREISAKNVAEQNLKVLLAQADNITDMGAGIYLIGEKQYFVKLAEGTNAQIVKQGTKQQLIAPLTEKIKYWLLW